MKKILLILVLLFIVACQNIQEETEIHHIESIDELKLLLDDQTTMGRNYAVMDFAMAENVNTLTKSVAPTASGDGYTTTNVQVEGIDEGDLVKTDGNYIYVMQNTQIVIVSKEGKITNTIPLEDQPQAIYVDNNKLYTLSQSGKENYILQKYDAVPRPRYQQITKVDVYDIKVPACQCHDIRIPEIFLQHFFTIGAAILVEKQYQTLAIFRCLSDVFTYIQKGCL